MRSCPRKEVIYSGETLTQLHFQEGQNVNSIMEKYKRTGVMGSGVQGQARRPMFGSFVGVDYREMCNVVAQGQQAFAQLPVHIRKRFGHDSSNLIEWLNNPANREEAESLGIVNKRAEVPAEAAEGGKKEGGTTAST